MRALRRLGRRLSLRPAAGAAAVVYAVVNAIANYTLTGANDSGGYTITKGGLTGYHAGPYTNALTGDFLAVFRLQTASGGVFGIDATTGTAGVSAVDYHLEFDGGANNATIKHNASYQAESVASAAGKYFFIRRVGTTVTFHHGATSDIGAATLLRTYTSMTGSFYVNTIIQAAGVVATLRVET
jgi:hypothetical protein